MRRAPHGARGLKRKVLVIAPLRVGRAPHGARGLKQLPAGTRIAQCLSRPAWGAWIETLRNVISRSHCVVAPRMGRVD